MPKSLAIPVDEPLQEFVNTAAEPVLVARFEDGFEIRENVYYGSTLEETMARMRSKASGRESTQPNDFYAMGFRDRKILRLPLDPKTFWSQV